MRIALSCGAAATYNPATLRLISSGGSVDLRKRIDPARLSELLQEVYATPLAPDRWPAVLRSVCQFTGVNGAGVVVQDLTGHRSSVNVLVGIDPGAGPAYDSYYAPMDPWRPGFLHAKAPEGSLLIGKELCPEAELKKTEFYNDLMLRFDFRLFAVAANVSSKTDFEFLTFYSACKGVQPGAHSLDAIRLLLPHLRSSLHLRSHVVGLEAKQAHLSSVLDAVDFGVILATSDGRALYANAAAKALSQSAGLKIHAHGPLSGSIRSESDKLIRSIASAAAIPGARIPAASTSMLLSRKEGSPLQVFVAPFIPPIGTTYDFASRSLAIVMISDPDRRRMGLEEVIEAMYGLTPAEAAVAVLIAQGASGPEVAEINQVSAETVKSQLKIVFQKMGVQRQTQLAHLVASIARVGSNLAGGPPLTE